MKKNAFKQTPVYYIIPLFLIATIIPLIVYLKIYPIDNVSYNYWIGDKENYDFFSYYKSVFIIVLAILSLVMFCVARYKKLINTKKMILAYIPIVVYGVAILFSAALSKYPNTAWIGFVDRYEGAYILLSYLAILFTTINLVDNEKLIKVMLTGLFVSASIVGIIGIFQFFGMDFFKSDLGRLFILPKEYRANNLAFTFGPHTIYSTLYNTNYVGSFMAMFLPLSLALFLYLKNKYYRISFGVVVCLMFANWIGCRSKTGYLSGAIAILLLIIICRKQIIKNIKSTALLFIAFILIFIGMNYSANGDLGRILTSVTNIAKGSTIQDSTQNNTPKEQLLNDISFSDNTVSITFGEDALKMSLEGNQLAFYDTEGQKLAISNDDEGNIIFGDERYSSYKIKFDQSNNIFDISLKSMKFSLYLQPSGFKIVGERGILLDKLDHPETAGFEGKEKFASMRGYIWSRSIPLLKNNIIIGGGPDTYVMQFPQHDYIGKLRAFDMVGEIIDKPHNMYLQVGINTGVVSLIALLFLVVYYLYSSLRKFLKKEEHSETVLIGIGLFAAVLGYCIAALANDSLVSVAPVFWIILGLGFSFNYLYSNTSYKIERSFTKPLQNPIQKQTSEQSIKSSKKRKA